MGGGAAGNGAGCCAWEVNAWMRWTPTDRPQAPRRAQVQAQHALGNPLCARGAGVAVKVRNQPGWSVVDGQGAGGVEWKRKLTEEAQK